MRVPHVLDIGDEPLAKLAVGQVAIALARPRTEMHFVNRHRPLEPRSGIGAAIHPAGVLPLVRRAADDRRRERRHFELEAKRIGLDQDLAAAHAQLELVAVSEASDGNENLPHAADAEPAHRVHAPVPVVEVADDADAGGVGGPDGEVDAFGRAERRRMRAELVVDPGMVAFAEQIEIVVGDDASEAVRIVDLGDVAAWIRHAQPIVQVHVLSARYRRFEDAAGMCLLRLDGLAAIGQDAH